MYAPGPSGGRLGFLTVLWLGPRGTHPRGAGGCSLDWPQESRSLASTVNTSIQIHGKEQ